MIKGLGNSMENLFILIYYNYMAFLWGKEGIYGGKIYKNSK